MEINSTFDSIVSIVEDKIWLSLKTQWVERKVTLRSETLKDEDTEWNWGVKKATSNQI